MQAKIKFSKLLITATVFLMAGFVFSNSAKAGVIFEDDFDGLASYPYNFTCTGTPVKMNIPTTTGGVISSTYPGLDGYKCPGGTASLSFISGMGHDGSAVARFGNQLSSTQSQAISLLKHLTHNQNTGYDELYIRYKFMFDNTWRSGWGGYTTVCRDDHTVLANGTACDSLGGGMRTYPEYWKWIRLWMHTDPNSVSEWTEWQADKMPIIIGYQGIAYNGNPCVYSYFADGTNTTCGVDHTPAVTNCPGLTVNWYKRDPLTYTDGCISNFSWDGGSTYPLKINKVPNPPGTFQEGYGWFTGCSESGCATPQVWHTVEWRIKLSTTDAGNGIFEVWQDGQKISSPTVINKVYGGTMTGINTKSKDGGINFITFFDNMGEWTSGWSNQKYIYLDNVVVSDSYIGPTYEPTGIGGGDTIPPAAPTGLAVQ